MIEIPVQELVEEVVVFQEVVQDQEEICVRERPQTCTVYPFNQSSISLNIRTML